jgi:hypothetical protein
MDMKSVVYGFYYVLLLCFTLSVCFWMVAWLRMLVVVIDISGPILSLYLTLALPPQGETILSS